MPRCRAAGAGRQLRYLVGDNFINFIFCRDATAQTEYSASTADGTGEDVTTIAERIQRDIREDKFYEQNFSNDGERFLAWYLRNIFLRTREEGRAYARAKTGIVLDHHNGLAGRGLVHGVAPRVDVRLAQVRSRSARASRRFIAARRSRAQAARVGAARAAITAAA